VAVLDVGCGPGHYLRQFGQGSVGIDRRPDQALEGIEIRKWQTGDGLAPDLVGKFDAVWCSNLLEHVTSPHEVLLELRPALRPHGRMFLLLPRTNGIARGKWRGFAASGHINFFKPLTLAWTMERAGFDVEWVGSPSVPTWTPLWLAHCFGSVGPTLAAVGRKIENWNYPDKSMKRLVEDRLTYRDA
jgi:SAM-dependent methyltransferase